MEMYAYFLSSFLSLHALLCTFFLYVYLQDDKEGVGYCGGNEWMEKEGR
jgi:hypothetical protein